MAICRDQSLLYLRDIGYNVIRHPRTGINPLDLVGVQQGEALHLGRLSQLVTSATAGYPPVATGGVATDIEGQSSSRMKIGIGVSLLGTLVGAMGGTIGANVDYTDARQISFQYTDVEADTAEPLAIGSYLAAADVAVGNPILREYVLGNGDLFVIYHVVRSDHLDVSFERSAGVRAGVNADKLLAATGGKVAIDTANAETGRIRFAGQAKLAFGFKCLRIILDEGELRLVGSKPGSLALDVLEEASGTGGQGPFSLIEDQPGMLALG